MRSAPAFAFFVRPPPPPAGAPPAPGAFDATRPPRFIAGLRSRAAPFAGLRGGIAKTIRRPFLRLGVCARAAAGRLDCERLQCRVFRDGRDGRDGRNTPRFLTQEVTVQGSTADFQANTRRGEDEKTQSREATAPLFAYARASRRSTASDGEGKKVSARQVEIPLRRLQPLPAWQAENQVRELQPLPAWQVERQLRADCLQPCPHGKRKSDCAACNPCPHGKVKYRCADCNPRARMAS